MKPIQFWNLCYWRRRPAGFAQAGPEEIRLTVGKSIVIDYPADIARISTSNPDIVDASPVTAREVLLHGKSFGTVTLVVWSKSGQRNFYNIDVEQNLEPLRKLLKETFPKEDIHVQSSRDSLSMTGRVSSKDVADRAAALAAPFAKTIVNNLQLALGAGGKTDSAARQVRRAGSLARPTSLRSTWFPPARPTRSDESRTGGSSRLPRLSSIQAERAQPIPPSAFPMRSNIFAFRPDLNLGALIQALQAAEPASDAGRTEPGHHQRQRSQFPGGRRVSGAGSAGRSQFRRRHDSVPRIRHPADISIPS